MPDSRKGSGAAEGVRLVDVSGFQGCVELSNRSTRVILEPTVGGRVLRYKLNGIEALFQDPALDGVAWDGAANILHPPGGRCDIGPEYGGLPHDELWFGRWTAEVIGARSARMTSPTLDGSGLQLVREYQLHETGSHLRCVQIMRNRGIAPLHTFHWGRTFAVGDGILLAPLPRRGRFPRGYALGPEPGIVDFLPAPDPNVRICDGVIEFIGAPVQAKVLLDVDPGWLAYISPQGLLFLKRFPIYPLRSYGELAANNASIWYSSKQNTNLWPYEEQVVEIEPIGPLEFLAPGAEASFAEDWWLLPFDYPGDRRVDLVRLHSAIDAAKPDGL